jgi:hypothetical protein
MSEERGITVIALAGITLAVVLAILLIRNLAKQQNQAPTAVQIQEPNNLE